MRFSSALWKGVPLKLIYCLFAEFFLVTINHQVPPYMNRDQT